MKKRILICDILVWTSFVLMLAVKFMTVFTFTKIQEISGAEIESVATAFEQNQLFKIMLNLKNIGYVLGVIILPAMLMTYYFYMRRKVLENKVNIESLEYFVYFAFFSLILNIVNDGAGMLGIFLR